VSQDIQDDAQKPDVALRKAVEMVESDGVQLIMGPAFPPSCTALVPYVTQPRVPLVISGGCPNQSLFTDPSLKSAYVVRITAVANQLADVLADWATLQGYRRAGLLVGDVIGGLEAADAFASAFVARGGAIVQESYPASGADYAGVRISPDAQALFVLVPEADQARFAAGGNGPRLLSIMQSLPGAIVASDYCVCLDSPENQAFLRAVGGSRAVTEDLLRGWVAAQVLEAAVGRVQGDVENRQAFLDALHGLDLATAKGPLSLDPRGDVVQNVYVTRIDEQGQAGLERSYPRLAADWDRAPGELAGLPLGRMKGQWVGMTRERLAELIGR
jgi:branched-chain amino acid transport system substrate-binding protein